ncbi:SCO family protein [Duganella sp. CY15W]|uniref:SCO family protein n=1 Tax=Duganella sp. CY15W TaxID=2692172 RepID=UPI001367D79F|nr:SCO family protein [Duganella sp. CY15W]MYM27555.1 SCO family protein [Duganella sp. CY15W]
MKTILRAAAMAAAVTLVLPVASTAAETPATAPASTSLYQLDTRLTDTSGQHFTLRDMAGAPVLVTMFYGDCHSACPIVIETLKRTVTALGPDGKRLRILLISLAPQRDNPRSLAMMAHMQNLDPAQYRLAVARDDSDTRMLASALNIRYRALDNGEINHTTRIALLNHTGAVQADSTRLDAEPDPVFVRQIAAALKR